MAFNFLVVDDSLIIRAMLIKTLEATGVPLGDVFQAANGQEGLDLLEENWIDLVFVDINMPVMDGVTMIEQMEQRDILQTMPTVVVSTEGSLTKIEKLWHKGIVAFIGKPFTPEMIRNIVQDILGEWQAETSEMETSDDFEDDGSF